MSNETLRPCPFCGEPPAQGTNQMEDLWHQINCESAKCDINPYAQAKKLSDAVSDWNTRPIEDALNGQIKALQLELKAADESGASSLHNLCVANAQLAASSLASDLIGAEGTIEALKLELKAADESGASSLHNLCVANVRLADQSALLKEIADALENLTALVRGECPALLSEDSGGDWDLDMRINAALSKYRASRATGEAKGEV